MPSVEDLWAYVREDAEELIETIGTVSPLLTTLSQELNELDVGKWPVGRFLRRLLTRNAIFILVRLIERPQAGPAEFASLPVLLELMESTGRLTYPQAGSYEDRIAAATETMPNRFPTAAPVLFASRGVERSSP